MNCVYCSHIHSADSTYLVQPAAYDLGSEAPRCALHWRYVCAQCGKASHFMATGYCRQTAQFFCRECASSRSTITGPFWGWEYWFEYTSPFSGKPCVSLDRLEFQGMHPLQRDVAPHLHKAIDRTQYLNRFEHRSRHQWKVDHNLSQDEIRQSWNKNAARWDARYDADGDPNRRYSCDEPMLAMLGDVSGLRVLDAGSGNGYLCRKLAKAGATMVGVELSEAFLDIAVRHETAEPLGISYRRGDLADMPFLGDGSFDRIVSNYVLQDVLDLPGVLKEFRRVLKPGGTIIATVTHPCFSAGPAHWHLPAADSPRREEAIGLLANHYFDRGPVAAVWANLDPVLGFHRPLRDYWAIFKEHGFTITGFEEPTISQRARDELPAHEQRRIQRVPFSCIFSLSRAG